METTKKVFFLVAACVVLSLLAYLIYNKSWLIERPAFSAALLVNSLSDKPLNVVLDGIYGKTPFRQEDLPEGEKTLTLGDGRNTFSTRVSLLPGTATVVNWSLGPAELFNEGEILWLEKTQGGAPFLVISSPDGAEVRLDGVLLGTTPLFSSEIAAGEHSLKLGKEGYRPREISLHLEEGYKLNIKVKLSLKPVAGEIRTLPFPEEPRIKLLDFSSSEKELLADTAGWVKGILYLLGEETDKGKTIGDYFLDYQGQIFDSQGVKLAEGSEGKERVEKLTVGYLGRQEEGFSAEAKTSLLSFSKTVFKEARKIEILPTGLGWLRVRDEPGLTGKEIAKVDVGATLEFLEERDGWYRVRLPEGGEGWLSAQYAKKL